MDNIKEEGLEEKDLKEENSKEKNEIILDDLEGEEKKESKKEDNKDKKELQEKSDRKSTASRSVASGKQSVISVNITKLDSLMDLVGELVISVAMVTQNPELKGLPLNNFYK